MNGATTASGRSRLQDDQWHVGLGGVRELGLTLDRLGERCGAEFKGCHSGRRSWFSPSRLSTSSLLPRFSPSSGRGGWEASAAGGGGGGGGGRTEAGGSGRGPSGPRASHCCSTLPSRLQASSGNEGREMARCLRRGRTDTPEACRMSDNLMPSQRSSSLSPASSARLGQSQLLTGGAWWLLGDCCVEARGVIDVRL